jgi:phosphatidylglycerol:prolipoprotein diacylglycerol transferase
MFPPIELGERIITPYGIAAAIGIIVAVFYLIREAKRVYGGDGDILLIMLFAAGGAVLGSHLLFGFLSLENYGFPKITSFTGFFRFVGDFFGGSVFYGGLIGGSLAAFITIRVLKTEWYPGVELLTTVVPLFHTFGRVGCFLSGCCYGIESEYGFIFTRSMVLDANGVRRFPVQLAEAGFNLVLFALLFTLFRRGKLRGRLYFLYLVLYGTARFLLEFLRGDHIRGVWDMGFGSLSTSQIISVGVFAVGLLTLIIFTLRGHNKSKMSVNGNG